MKNSRLLPAFALLAVLLAPVQGAEDSAAPRVVYRETFPDFRDPAHYLRTTGAIDRWEIVREPGEAPFLRLTLTPRAGKLRGLVVWDLAPLQFDRLAVRSRSEKPLFLSGVANDRFGNSYLFKPFGEAGAEGGGRALLPADGAWADYRVAFPGDLAKITRRGKEVSPSVYGRGDALGDWKGIDFHNLGIKTIHFHLDVPSKSPAAGSPFHVDLQLLELSTSAP